MLVYRTRLIIALSPVEPSDHMEQFTHQKKAKDRQASPKPLPFAENSPSRQYEI